MTPSNQERLKAREYAIETLIDMHPHGAEYRAARTRVGSLLCLLNICLIYNTCDAVVMGRAQFVWCLSVVGLQQTDIMSHLLELTPTYILSCDYDPTKGSGRGRVCMDAVQTFNVIFVCIA